LKKTLSFLLLAVMLFSCFFVPTISAQPLSFNPSELYVVGNLHDLVITPVEITNYDNVSVDVTVVYKGDTDVFIPNTVFSVPASSSRNFNVGFIIEQDEISWLEYTIGSQKISQLVIIKIEKASPSLSVFPDDPVAGSNVAFLITSGSILDAHGFLFCSDTGNIYNINIVDGMGSICLDDNETGSAIARITGDGIEPLFANFTIINNVNTSNEPNNNNGVPEVLTITISDTVLYGQTKDVTITKGVTPMGFESLLVSSPSGESHTWMTNSFGKWPILFNEVGVWTISILSNAQLVSKTVTCSKNKGSIILQTSNPVVDSDIVMNVFDDATIRVNGPGGFVLNGMELAGSFSFKPDVPGSYAVSAESDSTKAEISFNVKGVPSIMVSRLNGALVSYSSSVGDTLYVRLLDSDGSVLEIDTVVTVKNSNQPFSMSSEISLSEGYGIWTPIDEGSYGLVFDGSSSYDSVSSSIMITGMVSEGFSIDIWLIIGVAIVLVIIVLLLRRAPLEFWRKKLSNWKSNRKGKKSGGLVPPE